MKNIIWIFILLLPISIFSQELDELNNADVWSKQTDGSVVYYTKKDYGKIPVLCFHKIGPEGRYEITADNFEKLLIYLNNNSFYILSDKELIKKDFSKVPSGFTPIVLGSDDASEGNFEYKTIDDGNRIDGLIDLSSGKPELLEDTMVYLLEKHITPVENRINFSFYIAFDDLPFRQSGGQNSTAEHFRGLDIVGTKINYLLDNFIVGIHTVNHRVTKDISVEDFKWELNEFFDIMYDYVGNRVNEINTLAYPYGCADLDPKLRDMIANFSTDSGATVIGAFDFDGLFSKSPFINQYDKYEISRLGVDNQNIDRVYGFLENVPLYKAERVIVINNENLLDEILHNDKDIIIVGEL